ncbi:uncharacterized protein LOC129952673 [Eupeodes corollae]|uniref:uncharacterized protein LOC129952673 n=1 Tax=Eupeodes corollae TaxID=290404 RepID=UPI0024908C1F|nr:uncharacterized protein LOC129952673 [Eupeodes corollae]
MREEIQFNIKFCQEVQKHANLYDYFRSDYCLLNKTLSDQTWKKISKKFSASTSDCKERWKNIRGSYSKYTLKVKKCAEGSKKVKEYYLAPYLSFLDPFLKSRDTTGYAVIEKSSETDESLFKSEAEISECEDNYDNCEVVMPDECLSVHSSQSSTSPNSNSLNDESTFEIKPPESKYHRKRKISAITQDYDFNGRRMKSYKSSKEPDLPDSDLAFLHSILPDLKSMNSSQKRHFKIGILDLAEKILTPTSTSQQVPASSSTTLKFESP